METISRAEIEKERYRWLSYILNGEEIFREKSQYGNRDVRFSPIGSQIGIVHLDKFNALSQPISHLAHWLHEKTGINETALRFIGYGVVGYAGYQIGKSALKKL